jgi:hypothetical protein
MTQPDDDLLTALREARPAQDHEPSPASPAAIAMMTRILSTHPERERASRPIRRRLVLAGIPAVAGVAAIAAVVATRTAEPSPASPLPTAASVRTGVLDAFERSSGDISASVATFQGPHGPATVQQSWLYPAFPQPGQRVRSRGVLELKGDARDIRVGYVQPRSGRGPIVAQEVYVDYGNRTWSDEQVHARVAPFVGDGDLSPAGIRKQIADGQFTVAGTNRIAGRQAIRLYWSPPGRADKTTLWVDARTYLALRAVLRSPNGTSITVDYQILPATPANLKLLNPPIPAGFRRVGP